MATPPTFPASVASFSTATYNYDPLYASEVISQSAKIAPSLGVLKRGTVLFGPAAGTPVTGSTNLTTVPTGAVARFILAADIDTGTGSAVTGLVYSQGKFLDTSMIFSANGAASDAANLWDFGIYVLTVEQRSGLLVPMTGLPATGGPMPQVLPPDAAKARQKDDVEAIQAAIAAYHPGEEPPPPVVTPDPAWVVAAFGETERDEEDEARQKARQAATDLWQKQEKARTELEAKHITEAGKLAKEHQEERLKFIKEHERAVKSEKPAKSEHPPTTPLHPPNKGK